MKGLVPRMNAFLLCEFIVDLKKKVDLVGRVRVFINALEMVKGILEIIDLNIRKLTRCAGCIMIYNFATIAIVRKKHVMDNSKCSIIAFEHGYSIFGIFFEKFTLAARYAKAESRYVWLRN